MIIKRRQRNESHRGKKLVYRFLSTCGHSGQTYSLGLASNCSNSGFFQIFIFSRCGS